MQGYVPVSLDTSLIGIEFTAWEEKREVKVWEGVGWTPIIQPENPHENRCLSWDMNWCVTYLPASPEVVWYRNDSSSFPHYLQVSTFGQLSRIRMAPTNPRFGTEAGSHGVSGWCYGMDCVFPTFSHWSPNTQYLRTWLCSEMGPLRRSVL